MAKRPPPRKQADPSLIIEALGAGFGAPGVGQALLKGAKDRQRAAEQQKREKEAEALRLRLSGRSK